MTFMLLCMQYSSALMLHPLDPGVACGDGRDSPLGCFTSFSFGFTALELDHAGFARLHELSAAPTGDCEFGSGHWSCSDMAWDDPWILYAGVCPQSSAEATSTCLGGCITSNGYRFGEALHPGPPLTISVGNPTGLRSKEAILFGLPPGIHNLAETHLASDGMRAACGLLRNWASQAQRRMYLLPGASVPLRARSASTGIWAGVWQSADVPVSRVNLQWPQNEFRLGRAQAASFKVASLHILGVVIYAWPSGPTWPGAKQANRRLLQFLTQEVVLGSDGCRYITGDFNGSDTDYPEFDLWRAAGWKEAQELSAELTGSPPVPTCKGRTRPDRLFMSPQLAAMFQKAVVSDLFADHSVISATFDVPVAEAQHTWWPQASKVPWGSIDLGGWQQQAVTFPCFDSANDDPSQYLHRLGHGYEESFQGFFEPDPAQGLPRSCCGRAQVYEVQKRKAQLPKLKASRTGEEATSSDMICRALQKWFLQLRRIQSLLHNVRRNCPSPSALEYRLQTWRAILYARGFHGGFAAWWSVRPVQHHGMPGTLPLLLPPLVFLEAFFVDFRANYRALEAWHLRHRTHILKATTREHLGKAFKLVLGDQDQKFVDSFTTTTSSEILAVDPQTSQVHVESDIAPTDGATWLVDDVPATVRRVDDALFEVDTDLLLYPGQVLTQKHVVAHTHEMLPMLEDFWKTRWNKHHPPDGQDWTRILRFVEAFAPRLQFGHSPLTLAQWDAINCRYRDFAARGPDSFDSFDLQRMHRPFREGLVSLLNAVETGAPWPTQLLQGYGVCLPKHAAAAAIGDFRPIIILSTIYRSWSAIRSRALLRELASFASSGMKGFLPQRESGEIWFLIQSLVEVGLQQHSPLAGVITDVRKAFESVPRVPLMKVAQHLGIPGPVLDAWTRFLSSFQRRFLLHGQVSHAIDSNWGMPEGCGMSVLGMCLVDFCWDLYQTQFAPATLPLSYVDNYEVLAASVASALQGFGVLEEFMQLWHLQLDSGKTLWWSTLPGDRTQLRRLGKSVCLQTADLGGAMTFCRKRGLGTQQRRLDSLDLVWARLRKLDVCPQVKAHIIRQALWAKAFYAIGISLMPWKHVQQLRTKAAKALGHGKAGANPALRLALLTDDLCTDPGFYQFQRVLLDFRRLLGKQPQLLQLWDSFMQGYTGQWFSGPFSKLLEQFDLVHWTLGTPPAFFDHDGCQFDLLTLSASSLRSLMVDAWHQRLALEVSHRKDYEGLRGLHWPPSRNEARMFALDAARIHSVREGVFLTGSAQGKYDLVKGNLCKFCGFEDTLEHRVMHCPGFASVREEHPTAVQEWPLVPRALSEHLLPSRLPSFALHKRALLEMDDFAECFFLQAIPNTRHNVFTDGSCRDPMCAPLSLAAWGAVSATHGLALSAGPVHGLAQTVNRAELIAAYSVIRWTFEQNTLTTLWTDSAYVASGLQILLETRCLADFDSHGDLWQRILDLIQSLDVDQLWVQHIASHRDPLQEDDPVDEWSAVWNGKADVLAGHAHSHRSWDVQALHSRLVTEFFESERRIDRFRELHLALATCAADSLLGDDDLDNEGDDAGPLPSLRPLMPGGEWLEALPLGWIQAWDQHALSSMYEPAVVVQFVQWLQSECEIATDSYAISWLELTAMLEARKFCFPHLVSRGGKSCWISADSVSAAQYSVLTVAAKIRFVKELLLKLDRVFDLDLVTAHRLDLSCFGVHPPQQGLALFVSAQTLRMAGSVLQNFTCNRPIRVCTDIARPF